jgi:hypothetical protein
MAEEAIEAGGQATACGDNEKQSKVRVCVG